LAAADEYICTARGVNFVEITDVKTHVVENPPSHCGGLYRVFLKLTTDNAINGRGEAYSGKRRHLAMLD